MRCASDTLARASTRPSRAKTGSIALPCTHIEWRRRTASAPSSDAPWRFMGRQVLTWNGKECSPPRRNSGNTFCGRATGRQTCSMTLTMPRSLRCGDVQGVPRRSSGRSRTRPVPLFRAARDVAPFSSRRFAMTDSRTTSRFSITTRAVSTSCGAGRRGSSRHRNSHPRMLRSKLGVLSASNSAASTTKMFSVLCTRLRKSTRVSSRRLTTGSSTGPLSGSPTRRGVSLARSLNSRLQTE